MLSFCFIRVFNRQTSIKTGWLERWLPGWLAGWLAGLGWAGLGWARLGWAGLGQPGLGWRAWLAGLGLIEQKPRPARKTPKSSGPHENPKVPDMVYPRATSGP
jgi:hypothetical protein